MGYALVLGAADWRRAGLSTPVPASLLPVLASPHLAVRDRADLADQEVYQEAVRWATREINPTAALLKHQESDSFTVYDYVLDFLAHDADPIPEATWPVLIEYASPADLARVGHTAEVTYHQSEVALRAWRKAANFGQVDAAPMAAFNLGALLRQARECSWSAGGLSAGDQLGPRFLWADGGSQPGTSA